MCEYCCINVIHNVMARSFCNTLTHWHCYWHSLLLFQLLLIVTPKFKCKFQQSSETVQSLYNNNVTTATTSANNCNQMQKQFTHLVSFNYVDIILSCSQKPFTSLSLYSLAVQIQWVTKIFPPLVTETDWLISGKNTRIINTQRVSQQGY